MTVDFVRLQAASSLLRSLSDQEARALQLKNLCVNNGTWTIPEEEGPRPPAYYEISLFGVSAIGATLEDLVTNWLFAASNTLRADPNRGAL